MSCWPGETRALSCYRTSSFSSVLQDGSTCCCKTDLSELLVVEMLRWREGGGEVVVVVSLGC